MFDALLHLAALGWPNMAYHSGTRQSNRRAAWTQITQHRRL